MLSGMVNQLLQFREVGPIKRVRNVCGRKGRQPMRVVLMKSANGLLQERQRPVGLVMAQRLRVWSACAKGKITKDAAQHLNATLLERA